VSAADPSTNATMAVSAADLASGTLPSAAPSSAPGKAEQATGKPFPLVPVIAVVATLTIAVTVYMVMNSGTDSRGGGGSAVVSTGDNLTTEQRIRMQELLQSASTFSKIGNYEQAEENLTKVLEEFDCRNQEARRGLMALNPDAANAIVGRCE
jgi:hypothetical protein